jgi:hypothetical protein
MATDQVAARTQMAVFRTSDEELLAVDRDFLAGILAFQNT